MINYIYDKLPEGDRSFIESAIKLDTWKLIKFCQKQEMKMELAEINGRYDDVEEIERKVDILNIIIDARAKLN